MKIEFTHYYSDIDSVAELVLYAFAAEPISQTAATQTCGWSALLSHSSLVTVEHLYLAVAYGRRVQAVAPPPVRTLPGRSHALVRLSARLRIDH